MPNHKLTLLGHPARKKIQQFLQDGEFHKTERRLAFSDGIIAMSRGRRDEGLRLAMELYQVDLRGGGYIEQFAAMVQNYGFKKAENREADICAEAHLWMTLVALQAQGGHRRHRHPHPRHSHVWVYQIDSHNRPKEDSPCKNCQQWARAEFMTLNGT